MVAVHHEPENEGSASGGTQSPEVAPLVSEPFGRDDGCDAGEPIGWFSAGIRVIVVNDKMRPDIDDGITEIALSY
jgi:hypothetical protein